MRGYIIYVSIIFLFTAINGFTQDDVDISVFEEVWEKVAEKFYDKNLHNVDWEEIGQRYYEYALEARSQFELHQIINEMLGELNASHTALIEKEVYRDYIYTEFTNKKSWQFGLVLEKIDDEFLVSAIFEGGAADESNVLLDDVILKINGRPTEYCKKLLPVGSDPAFEKNPAFFIIASPQEEINLKIKRDNKIFSKTLKAKKTNMIEATRNSVSIFKVDKFKVGYIHIWHFLSSKIPKIVDEAFEEKFQDVDGVIVDLRGRGGNVIFMNRVFETIERFKKDRKKNVVALIDGNTRSAKEIFANMWKEKNIGPLIGRKTTGAVLAAGFFKMSDGSVLMLPVMDVKRLSSGKKLEGVGVPPDVFIEENKSDYSDEILDHSILIITKSIKRRKAI